MFTKLTILLGVALSTVVVPALATDSCSNGSLQCCNSFHDAHSEAGSVLLGAIGVAVQSVTGQVGVQCTPVVGNSCSSQTACCDRNNFYGGLVTINCNNISA
ncbi:hypothetical protein AX15_004627 [Amanita polypyramis BW_CC]|nr:hypothetical protein AX15_004627 [Amanita polypyramis BW_CC]